MNAPAAAVTATASGTSLPSVQRQPADALGPGVPEGAGLQLPGQHRRPGERPDQRGHRLQGDADDDRGLAVICR